MSTMARTEVMLREFAILKATSRSESLSNLRGKDNNSNRTRAMIIYEIPGIMLNAFVDCLLKYLQPPKLCL